MPMAVSISVASKSTFAGNERFDYVNRCQGTFEYLRKPLGLSEKIVR